MHNNDQVAVCRGCGFELRGKPYFMGGAAYHPETGERAKTCFYGGYVCSVDCDRRAELEMENSFPGAGGYSTRLSANARQRINDKWSGQYE